MKVKFTIILALSFLGCRPRPALTADNKIPVELIREDFREVTASIATQAPNPFYLCSRKSYDSLKLKIGNSLNQPLSPIQFYQKISPLVAALNDGHFQVFMSEAILKKLEHSNPRLYFPLTVFIDGNRIYTNKNLSSDTSIHKGTEIMSINHIAAKNLIESIRHGSYLAPNLENFFERRLEDHFYRSLLMEAGFRNQFTIEFGNKVENLSGVSAAKVVQSPPEPDDFSYRILEGRSKIGYFKLNTLLYDKKQTLDSVLLSFFKLMDQQKVTRLVIDIRNNLGGSTKLARAVFNYITDKKYKIDIGEAYFENGIKKSEFDTTSNVPEKTAHKFRGSTILLTNVKTYSSAHMMAIAFKNAGMGKVIGQMSAEPLFISGEVKELITTHTKCSLYFPTANFYLPGYSKDKISFFVPDIEINPTLADRINGIDKALALAKQMLN